MLQDNNMLNAAGNRRNSSPMQFETEKTGLHVTGCQMFTKLRSAELNKASVELPAMPAAFP